MNAKIPSRSTALWGFVRVCEGAVQIRIIFMNPYILIEMAKKVDGWTFTFFNKS